MKKLIHLIINLSNNCSAQASASSSTAWPLLATALVSPSATVSQDMLLRQPVEPVDIHPALTVVRSLPEFQSTVTSPVLSPWQTLLNQPGVKDFFKHLREGIHQVLDRLSSFLSKLQLRPDAMHGLPETVTQVLTWVVSGLLAFLILVGVYYLLTYLKHCLERNQPEKKPLNKPFEGSLLITSQHHIRQAQALSAQGDFTRAVRQMYLALLCLLNERQWVLYEESRTNREYMALMQGRAFLGEKPPQLFRAIARQFEESRYGHRSVDRQHYDATVEAFVHLEQLP